MTNSLIKILVIDDEINGLTLDRFGNFADIFIDELRDNQQEVSIELQSFLTSHSEIFTTQLNEDRAVDKAFLNDVLLNKFFRDNAPSNVLDLLESAYSEHDRLLRIKEIIKQAFPDDSFNIQYEEAPPSDISILDQYSLVIIDLFLLKTPGDELSVSFLESISSIENLPPIIMISSHFDNAEHIDPRKYFDKTKISATGLIPISKKQFTSPEFGSNGLQVLFEKLTSQRELSNQTRAFITSWKKNLEETIDHFSEMLWKLDASIMQQLYGDAIEDHQPFEDLLNSFLSKELLWYLENNDSLNMAVNNLSLTLNDFKDKVLLTNNVDISAHRSMLSHYFFVGSEEEKDLSNFFGRGRKIQTAIKSLEQDILKVLPFGAVLVSQKHPDKPSTVYINITQQCNLADFPRKAAKQQSSPNSIVLLRAKITPKSNEAFIPFNTTNLISNIEIRDPSSHNQKIYDVDPQTGEIISLGLDELIKLLKSDKLKKIGRLRPEIAEKLQQQVAIELFRPSQIRYKRAGICPARAYIKSSDGKILPFDSGNTFNILKSESNNFTIQNSVAISLTGWAFYNIDSSSLKFHDLYTHLSGQLKLKMQFPLQELVFKFEEIPSLSTADTYVKGISTSRSKNTLLIVLEKT